MTTLARAVTGGAAWMVSFRFLERGIGVISTIILARLLVPEDFGLVAMSMAVYALISLLGNLGLEAALIKDQNAERRHYDTAWTFYVLFGITSAAILIAIAPFMGQFFGDERLTPIIYALALLAFIQGWQNIGIVEFRKELLFHKDFQFLLTRKLVAVVSTIVLAIIFRSYWALIGGILLSRATAVGLSYWMHSYRPRFSLAGTGDIFYFSGWIFLNHLATYVRGRGAHFIIGRMTGADILGLYTVSREISNLPTSELQRPIMRAVFPGFAKIAHNPERLRLGYLKVQGLIATLTIPAGIGVVVLAEPLVHLLLGSNWLAAIPLMQVLGLYGATRVLQGNSVSLFMALGKPYWVSILVLLETIIALPLMGWLLLNYGIEVAVWAFVVGGVALIPIGMTVVSHLLDLNRIRLVSVVWRPLLAAGAMGGGLLWASSHLSAVDGAADAALQLLVLVPTGFLVYLATLLTLWWFAGLPQGAESRVLSAMRVLLFVTHRAESGTPKRAPSG